MAEPGGILGEIVARKRVDVATRLGAAGLADIAASAGTSTRSLAAALRKPGARFITEVKRASPSGGAIRAGADAATIARGYRGAADAVSVLTDTPYFGGSLADLAAVRAAFDGPVLCKDFIVDPRQIAEARLHGADAVLIMLSVLSDAEALAFLGVVDRFGMEALVEVHDEAEMGRALGIGASIIGINNRDLLDLEVDLAVTERLAPLAPPDRIVVSESGIATRADVVRLGGHADAFLVGSSLMGAGDPGLAARALAFGRVKVCGLADAEGFATARSAGASFAGIVMVPGTPRHVEAGAAERLAAASDLPLVGVFRNAPPGEVAARAAALGLHAVQLHGQEDEAYIDALRRSLAQRCEIWAAAAVADRVAPARAGATRTLFDTGAGGTGRTFDWELLVGRDDLAAGVLAGGLNPDNAAAASRVGAFAIDVCSGVESRPGRKDPAKVAAFFDALRLPARGEAALC